MEKDATIAAIATPPGAGGIGIVRISGPDALGLAGRVFRRRGGGHPDTPGAAEDLYSRSIRSHRLYFGRIVHPRSGRILDEVLLAVMRAPHSYTREDVVEIQAHAGPAVLHGILDLILEGGARLADPGEFTQRAFINGRIDLTQAEAVIDLINARSDVALAAAARQMRGDLRSRLDEIAGALTQFRAAVEAGIDFPDDTPTVDWNDDMLLDRFRSGVIAPIENLVRNYEQEHVFRDGLQLAIVGRPNVGKSSLMNCLLGKDRAIVTDSPGTTRDLIEGSLQIHGIPVNLIDTAGLHDSDDPIEFLGMQKTREGIEAAQQVLVVVEGHRPVTQDDLHVYTGCRSKAVILVINKIDLTAAGAPPLDIPAQFNGVPRVCVSALHRQGIDLLKETIVRHFAGRNSAHRPHGAIPNLRHKRALERALKSARAVVAGAAEERPAELIAIDLKETRDAILSITGQRADGDVLDTIFKQFCIGK